MILFNHLQIATLNSLAYKGVTKRGLQKKLDKRIEENVALFDKLDDMVDQAKAKIDFDKLNAQYGKEAEALVSIHSFHSHFRDLVL